MKPQNIDATKTVQSNSNNEKFTMNKDTLSDEMRSRIVKIDDYLRSSGYILAKKQGYFPVFQSQDGRKKYISPFNSPAGFSWIGAFFGFAVCTQIREWSFFYVLGIVNFVSSVASVVLKRTDITEGMSTGVGIMYGIYFPYLRYIALSRGVPEISKGKSILLGMLILIAVSIPGILINSFFLPK